MAQIGKCNKGYYAQNVHKTISLSECNNTICSLNSSLTNTCQNTYENAV